MPRQHDRFHLARRNHGDLDLQGFVRGHNPLHRRWLHHSDFSVRKPFKICQRQQGARTLPAKAAAVECEAAPDRKRCEQQSGEAFPYQSQGQQ